MSAVPAIAAQAGPQGVADAVADELVGLTILLSDLAYDLGSDPETLRRHVTGLQAIDRITQTQLALADMLRSDMPVAERLDRLTLADLAVSLRARLGAG